jgi:hypothetical protein
MGQPTAFLPLQPAIQLNAFIFANSQVSMLKGPLYKCIQLDVSKQGSLSLVKARPCHLMGSHRYWVTPARMRPPSIKRRCKAKLNNRCLLDACRLCHLVLSSPVSPRPSLSSSSTTIKLVNSIRCIALNRDEGCNERHLKLGLQRQTAGLLNPPDQPLRPLFSIVTLVACSFVAHKLHDCNRLRRPVGLVENLSSKPTLKRYDGMEIRVSGAHRPLVRPYAMGPVG